MLNMRLFLSVIISFFIVFPIAMIEHGKDFTPKGRKQREQEREELKKLAIERGHVVTAKLIKIQTFSDVNPMTHRSFESEGIYEYFYNGKRYKYHFGSDDPEYTMTLYFVDNPRKATIASSLKRDPIAPWPVVYLIVLAIVYWIMSIST